MPKIVQSHVVYLAWPTEHDAQRYSQYQYLPSLTTWVADDDESAEADVFGPSVHWVPHWSTKYPTIREFYPRVFMATQTKTRDEDSGVDSVISTDPSEIISPSKYHSIVFDYGLQRFIYSRISQESYHTYNTWHLIPLKRPIITPPETEPIIDYFQTPQKDMVYSSSGFYPNTISNELPVKRTGTFEFKFEDDFINSSAYDYVVVRHNIDSALNGRIMSITLEDEMEYNYCGVVHTEWEEDQTPTLTITVDCEPFKYGRYIDTARVESGGAFVEFYGDFASPANVGINVTGEVESMTINGLARNPITMEAEPITVNNLSSGDSLTIYGERKLVDSNTVENPFTHTDFWEFPSLLPGINYVVFDSPNAHLQISARPRYL